MRQERDDVTVWFEIPVSDFERASGFYEAILATRLERRNDAGRAVGVFPAVAEGGARGAIVTGALVTGSGEAARDGTVVFLNCDGKLEEVAGRVEAAGGRLLTPRVDLPGSMGSFYHIADSEGNRVGLHAVS